MNNVDEKHGRNCVTNPDYSSNYYHCCFLVRLCKMNAKILKCKSASFVLKLVLHSFSVSDFIFVCVFLCSIARVKGKYVKCFFLKKIRLQEINCENSWKFLFYFALSLVI